ncbi:MAG: tetratricopeptide repeat protein, partial [Treponema sp.]|nr:tetratricopeptide repeat protein [Treponema sp.]
AAAETDSKQIALIKESVQEEDSLFLVWLSEHYGELFTTTGGFWKLNTSDRFYLLSRFPFLSYKEFMGNNWEQAAISDLIILIHTSPGRLDLFETYAAQGLPFNGKAPDTFVNWRPTAMCYLAMFFKDKNIINDERAGFELVRFLSKHGADINEGSGQGELPLSIAVLKRNVPLVKLFLELGADPNRVDSNGCAPLMLALYKWTDNGEEEEDAVVNDRIAIANMLLDYNVNVRLSDEDSRTPLLLAIYLESAEKNSLVSRLLDAGLDINERNDDGHTPLSIAVITYGNAKNKQSALEVIELLLKKGAKTETLSTKGYFSPLMVAADVNAVDAAQMLLKYGARKNFSDEDGETAFVYAAKRNYTQMMELVDPGADYKSKNSLFSFLKAAVSILAIGAVFLTIDVLARAILTFHLSYPVLWGVSLFLSHLLTAYILIALLGLREYLIRLRGAFNFIGSGLRYIVGVPIVFPLLILPLQFLTRFLPAQITSALSYPAELLTRPTTGFAMLAGYIVLLGAIMTGTVYFNRVNEKFSKQMELYRYYSGSLKTSSGNNKSILKYVLAAAVIGLIVFLFFMLKNSPKEAAPVSINTPNVQEFVENGQKYYDKGDYDNAIKQFDEVIKNDPKNALGYAWRGNTYRRKNQLDTAIKDFNEAVSLDPAYSFAYSRRGEAYRAKGDLRTAVKDFNEALKLDPNDSWAYGSRGQAHKQLGQTEQAIQDFRKALSLDPGIEWVKKELQAMEAPKPAKEPEAAETMEAAETTEAAEN